MNHRSAAILTLCLGLSAATGVQAQFLDFSQPARATALGGNLVALPEGPSALAFNPAGLALLDRAEASARYQSLFTDFSGDNLSTGNLMILVPLGAVGSTGLSWDHLGANLIAQDRLRGAWGKNFPVGGFLSAAGAGFSLSYLAERYTLTTPLQGVSVNQLSPSSFSFGAGLLLSFSPGLDLGFSAEDINNPNLGVVGVDRQPVLLRWGLAAKFMQHRPIQVTLTASQFLSGSDLQTQGGVECFLAQYGVKFRGGLSPYQGSVGLGFDLSDFFIDYAYSFTSFASAQLSGSSFPGSHLVEIGCQWGSTSSQVLYAENLKRAQQAESTANWEKALRWYQECLSAKSGDPEATQGRKRMLVEYNRQRAAQYYKDGQEARKQGMIFDAQNDYELASKLAPGNTDYSKALSQAAIEAERASSDKDVAEAIRQTSELIAKDDSKGALKVIFRALQRHPHNPSLELIQGSLGQEEESPAEEAKASPDVKKAKETAKLMTTEADLYLAHGQVDLAKENLEKALKANPNNTQIKIKLIRMAAPTPTVSPENQKLAQELYEKGLQNYLEGKLEDAIKDWEDALKADPLNTRVQNNLIRAKIEEKMEHP